ncbi:lipoate synthase [Acetivibrio straminisolvens JCM 21531]|jgi:lipoic acid synthetase|uniref:Lipoyl synthase n=2 Tax=Acetivibrio straminisolvens TaxID=253314 RepID=W4V426_9FIRM|nr:lipoate synthase [Acetivibrio straminisolvens JCM 21531]
MNEQPLRVDGDEPERIAGAVVELRLSHVVVTSVTRDDLEDGGASHFFKTVKAIHRHSKMTSVEVLVPDFNGNEKSLNTVLEAKVDVLGHNIETVASLYGTVRPGANYERSLSLLSKAKKTDSNIITKSGFMVGLGETANEVFELMKDLKDTGCDILTIGQYLKPSRKHMDVVEYVHPDIFKEYKQKAYQIGFKHVESGPLVRSSYRSSEAYKRCRQLTVNPHM